MNKKMLSVLAFTAALGVSGTAGAVLIDIDPNDGMIYDDVLKITWLQDANYAFTSGYAAANAVDNGSLATDNIFADGRMGWDAAKAWADQLVYGGYDDWRLPTVTPINGSAFQYYSSSDYWTGSRDVGYNVSAPGTTYAGSAASELAYMYYNNLGLKGFFDTSKTIQSDSGIFGNGTGGGQNNVGLINNLQSSVYWSGTGYAPGPSNAWIFYASYGYQDLALKTGEYFAWAMRDGDVAAASSSIPEPGSLTLVGLGLVGLGWARQRKT